MIRIGDKEYRNLEEQVLKNKEDIANHYNMDRVLAEFGIRIIGTLEDADELKDVPTPEQYGDAYAVGTEAPYDFYIWTRADANAGHPEDYWLSIGKLAIAGPQGPVGETGPKGDRGIRGSEWFSGSAIPSNPGNYEYGDTYLRSNGDVYQIKETNGNKVWVYVTNIRGPVGATGNVGPQGPQGVKGNKGDKGNPGTTGALCNIVGEITSVDQLPTPTPATRYNGFLQEINGDQHLWVVVGPDNNLQWMDIGKLGGGGTKIIKNGVVLEEYDVSNVVMKNDFYGEGFVYHHEGSDIFVTEPRETKLAGKYPPNIDAVPGRNMNGTMDVMTDAALDEIISAVAENLVVKDDYPIRSNEGCLRRNQATPRGYVDAKFQKAITLPRPLPTKESILTIDNQGLTGLLPLDSVVKVDCRIVRRGHALVLPRDRMYLIRGYSENTCTLKNNQGDVIAENFTMAFGAISSTTVEENDPTKTWAGFMYISNTGGIIPSINWNGNLHQEVILYNNYTSVSGSGNLYVYSIGSQ